MITSNIYWANLKLCIVLLFIGCSASAQSKILFSRSPGGLNTGGTLNLLVYDLQTKTTSLVIKGTVNRRGEYNAVTSPDNSQILFNTYRYSGWKLAMADFSEGKTSKVRRLTARGNYEYRPKFSPDGNQIAYQEYNWSTDKSGIFVADKNGKNPKHLIDLGVGSQNLDWTRDNKSVVFTYLKDNSLGIYSKAIDGGALKKISTHTANDFAPSTSKTADKLAFLSDKTGKIDLFVMDLDGKNLSNLTADLNTVDADANDIWAYSTAWSPDGKQIVFNAMLNGNLELFVVNVDGTGLSQITKNKDSDITPFWIH